MLSRWLYNLGIQLYLLGIRVKATTDPKARQWIRGRKDLFQKAKAALGEKSGERIWIHCASLGEFEQGRPVIEALKNQYPHVQIVLTFFSPSGFEVRKNYNQADHVCYLPLDTPANARRWLDIIQPDVALFVKYEFWYHYLHTLQKRGVPTILFSSIFRQSQPFFKWYGEIFRKMLRSYTIIFTQDTASYQLLQKLNITEIAVAPDTRFDRVWDIATSQAPIPDVEQFIDGQKTCIAGSSWPVDNKVLGEINVQAAKLIIAPHSINEDWMKRMEATFPGQTIRYSQLGESLANQQVLIIDNIGMLAALYRYADVVYVGGGFGEGIHNTLEAAVYGVPILFGPNYEKFREARLLIELGGAYATSEPAAVGAKINELLDNDAQRQNMGAAARQFVLDNLGGTEKIMGKLDTYL